MADHSKTHQELTREMAALKQRLRELESAEVERGLAGEASRENEEKYRNLVENLNEIVYAVDDKAVITYVSSCIRRLGGYDPDDLIGKPYFDFVHPDDKPGRIEHFRKILAGSDEPSEFRCLAKDGTPVWVRTNARAVVEGDRVTGIQGSLIDITDHKRTEEELVRQKVHFESLFTNTNDAIVFTDIEHKIVNINKHFTRLFGYEPDEIRDFNINTVLDPHGSANNNYASLRFLRGEKVEMEAVRYDRNGDTIDVLIKGGPVILEGRITGGYAIYTDIREKKRAEEALVESRKRLEAILASLDDAVFMSDPATRLISECNDAVTRIFGYSREEIVGRESEFLHVNRARFEQLGRDFTAAFENPGYYATEFEMRRKDGDVFPTEHFVRPVRDSDNRILYVVSVVRDVSERKRAEEKIHQMAYYDSLTGLPNRALFSDRLGIALARARRNQKGVAVIMLDLDNFKDINDTLGHDAGDMLLKAAAVRLRAALRRSDTVARFGGDEFVLVLPDLKGVDDVIPVARKLVESFRKPFPIQTHQPVVTTSMGITVYPDDGTDEGVLLKNADIAMYQAKQAGRDRYRIYQNS